LNLKLETSLPGNPWKMFRSQKTAEKSPTNGTQQCWKFLPEKYTTQKASESISFLRVCNAFNAVTLVSRVIAWSFWKTVTSANIVLETVEFLVFFDPGKSWKKTVLYEPRLFPPVFVTCSSPE